MERKYMITGGVIVAIVAILSCLLICTGAFGLVGGDDTPAPVKTAPVTTTEPKSGDTAKVTSEPKTQYIEIIPKIDNVNRTHIYLYGVGCSQYTENGDITTVVNRCGKIAELKNGVPVIAELTDRFDNTKETAQVWAHVMFIREWTDPNGVNHPQAYLKTISFTYACSARNGYPLSADIYFVGEDKAVSDTYASVYPEKIIVSARGHSLAEIEQSVMSTVGDVDHVFLGGFEIWPSFISQQKVVDDEINAIVKQGQLHVAKSNNGNGSTEGTSGTT